MIRVRSRKSIAVLKTGIANTASVLAAAERSGGDPHLTDDPDEIRRASYVILPGVGSFQAAAEALVPDLRTVLLRRIEADRPTLGICLGMQLFCTGSEESPEHKGLGIIPRKVTHLQSSPRVPALGWSQVSPKKDCQLLRPGWAYFAHSFALHQVPGPWAIAIAGHDQAIAAFEHGNILACQFHPELSGSYGAQLLDRWLQRGAQA